MSLKNFLKESSENYENTFSGFGKKDIGTLDVNESRGKKSFSINHIKEMSNDEFAKDSASFYDILWHDGSFYGTVWYKNFKIRKYRGSIQIFDVTNALKAGKSIPQWSIYATTGINEFDICFSNYLATFKSRKLSLEEFLKTIFKIVEEDGESLYLNKNGEYDLNDYSCIVGMKFDADYTKGIRVFSPLAILNINPLKKMPKKWKVNDLIKAIANNQYSYLGRDYKYTDDYAYDSAYNYGANDFMNPISMIEEIIENPRWYNHIMVKEQPTDIDGVVQTLRFGSSNESFTIVVNLGDSATTPEGVVKRAKKGHR